jgi:hypothetical protein
MWEPRSNAAAQRFADRLEHENSAQRLSAVMPTLASLKLEVQERRGTWPSADPEGSHVKHIVVATAPAVFVITCHDAQCRDGGYDVTALVMRALRSREQRFECADQCRGRIGTADCQRVIKVVGTATYHQTQERS